MTPTRQEMIDSINMKIARTGGGTGPGETGYYLPVMIGDILKYVDTHCFWEDDFRSFDGNKIRDMETMKEAIVTLHYLFIRGQQLPLSAQDDDCISYIYNLVSHD